MGEPVAVSYYKGIKGIFGIENPQVRSKGIAFIVLLITLAVMGFSVPFFGKDNIYVVLPGSYLLQSIKK